MNDNGSDGDFAGNAGVHQADDFFVGHVVAQQKHQFGDHALGRAVVSVDYAGLKQLQTGAIAAHLNGALRALGDVDQNNPLGA